jgi:AMP-polyphosphate phosphotransferase
MLEQVVLDQKLSSGKYKDTVEPLREKLGQLQRQARDSKVGVLVVFEGWDAAGKGTLINQVMQYLDPRGFNVHTTKPPTEEERFRPFLWRFWGRTPEKGRIAIFDRSWYGRVIGDRVDGLVNRKTWQKSYEEIRSFERQLTDDGFVLVKLFLHISKGEQRKRFRKLESHPSLAWRVTREDWKRHGQHSEYLSAIEDALAETNTGFAPWTIVEAENRKFATVKVFNTLIGAIQEGVSKASQPPPQRQAEAAPTPFEGRSVLDSVDLSLDVPYADYRRQLPSLQKRARELEHEIYVRRIPVVIVFEGWDAAGKGGAIKRLTKLMDPRGYEVIPIAAPNDVEKAHHYLWRFWTKFPKAGHLTIFDRSWYGRVLVERVEGLCRPDEYKRAYREINEMEAQFASFGAVIIKFWLQVDKEEQLNRFEARQDDPAKQWKINEEDWRNRDKWEPYERAVEDMLTKTSTTYAPWTIVESNSKRHGRIKTIRTVVEAIEKRLAAE